MVLKWYLHHKNDEIITYTLGLSLILSFFTVAKVLTIFSGVLFHYYFRGMIQESCLFWFNRLTPNQAVCVFFLNLNFQNKKLGRTHASRSCYGWDRQL